MTAITGKLSSFNTLLKCNLLAGDAIGVFRDVAYIQSISGPSLSLDVVDLTAHDSAGAWEEAIPTILRSGELTLDLLYDPAEVTIEGTTNGLIKKMKDKTLITFKIYFNNNTVEGSRTIWTLPGYVTGFEPSMPHDGALTATLKFKPASAPTLL